MTIMTPLEVALCTGMQSLRTPLNERIYHWDARAKEICPQKFYACTHITENTATYYEHAELLFFRRGIIADIGIQYRTLVHRATSWNNQESIERIGALRPSGPDMEEFTLLDESKEEHTPAYCLGVDRLGKIVYSSENNTLENAPLLHHARDLATLFPTTDDTKPFNENTLNIETLWKTILPIITDSAKNHREFLTFSTRMQGL